MSANAWIGFDLDGTLAMHGRGIGSIGYPIPRMVNLVKEYLRQGVACRIVTARVGYQGEGDSAEREKQEKMVRAWCQYHIGQELEVTCSKDYNMLLLYDDRCVAVRQNTGELLSTHPVHVLYHGCEDVR